MAHRRWRRGFARLALIVWACGAVAIVWWSDEPLFSPLADVCEPEIEPVYPECYVGTAPPPEAEVGLAERLLGRALESLEVIDPARELPRWRTERYRDAARATAVREAWWLALVWVPFWVLAWALAGFRAEPPA